jgi:hypothetical protein
MVIKVLDLAPSATTAKDGTALYQALSLALRADDDAPVDISFSLPRRPS